MPSHTTYRAAGTQKDAACGAEGASAHTAAGNPVPTKQKKLPRRWLLLAVLLLVLSTGDAAPSVREAGRAAGGKTETAWGTAEAVYGAAEARSAEPPPQAEKSAAEAGTAAEESPSDPTNGTTAEPAEESTREPAGESMENPAEKSTAEPAAEAIADGFQKVTPTAEELAALLDPDGEAAESGAEKSGTAESGTAEGAETAEAREETWLVFQGRSVYITPEASWSSFRPGDFVWEGDRVRYTGTAYDAVFGIDVSRYHNEDHGGGHLDWEAARKDGVEFAIIRAASRGSSAGKLYEDPFFAMNAEDAHAAGIITGAYIYSQAVSVAEAVEEAEFLLSLIEGHTIDGPVCYDWELPDRSSRAWSVPPETATAAAAAFCDRIAEAGYRPMIYESKTVGYMKYDQAVLEPYMRWYPQYPGRGARNPCPDFLYHMDLWQFSDRCTVAGIGKRTDGSLWFRPKAGN